jgi:plastocyanin
MHFTTLTVSALLSTLSVAQMVDVQVVNVGKNPLNNATDIKFWPEKITAKPGSMVQFQFWAGNHTVTQSNFDNPCVPIAAAALNGTRGIDSGFQPVSASVGEGSFPTFTIMIKDEKPMWLYCNRLPHCIGGMAMVINENTGANATRSLDNYKTGAAGVAPPADAPPADAPPAGGDSPSAPGGDSPDSGSPGSGSPDSPSTPGGETGTTPGSDGGAGAGAGTGAPTDGTAPPANSPLPVGAAGRTAAGVSSLLLAIGASLLLL